MLNPNPDHSLQALPGLAHLVGGDRGPRPRVDGPKDYRRTSVAPQCAHLTVPKSLHRPRDKHAERQTRGKNGAQKGQSASFRVVISLFVPLGGGSAVRQSGAML